MCATRPLTCALGPLIEPGVPDDVARAAFDPHWHSLRGALDSAVAATPRAWIAEARAPVTIVQGTEDDVTTASALKQALAGLDVDISECAGGHQIPLTHAWTCRAVLRRVLEKTKSPQ